MVINPIDGLSEIIHSKCPPPVKLISSSPSQGAKDVQIDSPIVMVWDKHDLDNLSDGIRDLKPALESVNISGGRYRMGTLLTTEWGIGGTVLWEDNKEIITPEASLEPGTQYRLWTYHHMTIRDNVFLECQRIGGEVIFRTAGTHPDDGNPIREIDLSTIYHGDIFGMGTLNGPIKDINLPLQLVIIGDKSKGNVTIIVYKGIPLFKNNDLIMFEDLKVGDSVEVTFKGGRVVTLRIAQ